MQWALAVGRVRFSLSTPPRPPLAACRHRRRRRHRRRSALTPSTTKTNNKTSYITPPGTGFLPRETALHHQEWVLPLVEQALEEAGVAPSQVDVIAYTKGPGMGGPLVACAVASRMLSQLWGVPLVGVNHCVGACLGFVRLGGEGGLLGGCGFLSWHCILQCFVCRIANGRCRRPFLNPPTNAPPPNPKQ
jgi:hypothetical protein